MQEQACQALVALCDSLGTLPGCLGPADDSGLCAVPKYRVLSGLVLATRAHTDSCT